MFRAQGTVIKILPRITGTGQRGEWEKQDFIIETVDGKFEKNICFTVFNKPELIKKVGVGHSVIVSFNLDAHEHGGKWYNSINAYKIDANPNEPEYQSDQIEVVGEFRTAETSEDSNGYAF